MLIGWREGRPARHWLKIAQRRDQLVVQQMRGQEVVSFDALASGAALPPEIARVAQKSFTVVELSADDIISRRMDVPAQARDLLPGIVRNQIERLSPWRVNQAVYGFDARDRGDTAGLDVRVLITSRAVLDEASQRAGALGLRVDRVVAGEGLADVAAPVTMWSRAADASDQSLSRARKMIAGFVAATVAISVAVSAWAFITASSADSENDEVAARVATLQRQLQGDLPRASIASLAPPERAWALKETSPVAVVVIEALSRSLPDTSYLTELHLERATLRIVGLANDAPSLIAPLEQSGHLKDVHFFAPTTRDSDGARFLFHIEARVEPHLKIGAN
ncbi:PilN domain-containing protein [Bradyrhizobium macuxiense]|nr:PilN domain-containing protein [Bradyrhizobium macuxiense]